MKELQQSKILQALIPDEIVNDGAFTSQVIDLNDFEGAAYVEFVGILGSIDAAMAELKVMESDTKTDDTTLGGDPQLVHEPETEPGADDSGKTFVIGVTLRHPRARYLQLQASAGNGAAGTYLTAIAIATRLTTGSSGAKHRGMLFAEYAEVE